MAVSHVWDVYGERMVELLAVWDDEADFMKPMKRILYFWMSI